MLFRSVGVSKKLLCRSFGSPAPPAVPTAQELAENVENIKKFRKLQGTSGMMYLINVL